jgi:hypothetical protein
LLPGTAGCLTLITSRRQLAGLDDAHTVRLDVLARPDATALFVNAVGSTRVGQAELPLVDQIAELCGCLPLAIQLAASRLRHRPGWSVAQLYQRLLQEQRRLGEFEAGERSVAASFRLSYEHLDAELRRLFRLLGLHPGADIGVNAAAALAGVAELSADRMLNELLDANLLQQSTPDRYRFHDLIRSYAARLCAEQEPESDQQAALSRLFDQYVAAASAAVATIYPFRRSSLPSTESSESSGAVPAFADSRQATTWLECELDNLLAAASEASRRDRPADNVRLASVLYWHLRLRARYTDSEPLHARAVHDARRIGDRQAETEALIALGHARRGLGEYSTARPWPPHGGSETAAASSARCSGWPLSIVHSARASRPPTATSRPGRSAARSPTMVASCAR